METSNDVVVGVDGSETSLAAAEQAAEEAALRGTGLRVVQALSWPSAPALPGVTVEGSAAETFYSWAETSVDEAVSRARSVAPDVEVTGSVALGEVLPVLTELSGSASLLVVGGKGKGGFRGLLLGSIATHLASHSRCPLLVVRGTAEPSGPIVAGVDGSAANRDAIAFAFAEASLRGADLVAAHTWSEASAPSPVRRELSGPDAREPGEPRPGELREERKALLSEALAGYAERYPDVHVEHHVVRGGAREGLVDVSKGARMLVVGARGHGGFTGMLLGSVSHAVLHHAHCPVVVVPSKGDR